MSADTTAKIIRLLKNDDIEVRCSAAMVLGRLKPVEDRVVKALRKGMKDAPAHAKSYFLDALLKTKSSEVVGDIAALLEEKGSLVDQAVGVLRQFGGAALKVIEKRHQGEKGWRNGAYIKTVAGIHQLGAAKMLLERLPYTSWEEARGTSLFIAEHYKRYPQSAQRYLEKTIVNFVSNPPADLPAYGLVTCVKLIHRLRFTISPDVLITLAETNDTPSLRRHALDALEFQAPDKDEIAGFRERLFDLLASGSSDVEEPSAQALSAWRTPRLPAATLRDVANRDGLSLKTWAFQELVRRRDAQATTILTAHLDHEQRPVRTAAAQALNSMKDGPEALFDFFDQSDSADLRREMADHLVESTLELSDATKKRLRKRLADSFVKQSIDHGILHLLGHKDRYETNAFMMRRAKKLLKEGLADSAIDTLQPLVRFRHGTHDSRFLLAAMNYAAAESVGDDSDKRYLRCIDILSPLSRVHGFDLPKKLRQARSLTDDDRVVIMFSLCQRGGMEKAACRQLIKHIDSNELSEERRALMIETQKILAL